MQRPRDRIRNSLRYIFFEFFFGTCVSGLFTDYITPYALALKATVKEIGMLNALPSLVSSFLQFKTPDLAERIKKRKAIITVFSFLHGMMILPIILIPYCCKSHPVIYLIMFYTLLAAFSSLPGPVYLSMLLDYIPYRKRGTYFGWRSRMTSVVAIAASFIAGIILNYFGKGSVRGFLLIFSMAFVCRMISWFFTTKLYEARAHFHQSAYFSFADFIKSIKGSNFAQFTVLIAAMQFCVNIASPFFSVFMLSDLKFDYLTYTIIVTCATVVQIFTVRRWGKVADKIGNVKIIKFTAFLIAAVPLFWIVNHSPWYLASAQIVSGFALAGFNLCMNNFLFDAVTPQKMIRCIAYFSFVVGMSVFFAASAGGFILGLLPPFLGYKILSLLVVSFVLRLLVAFVIVRTIREVRTTQKLNGKELVLGFIGRF